jgi:negative regulator of replication initiation
MRFHHVQVDDDVFQFVKTHAEPLVDDFNSTLRRLLPLKGPQPRRPRDAVEPATPAHSSILPPVPNGTPIALRHILEVACLVRSGVHSRTGATQFVAKQHNVFPQTVIDKYCRQLGLTASQFDRLLEEENLAALRKLLKAKFSDHSAVVDRFLK